MCVTEIYANARNGNEYGLFKFWYLCCMQGHTMREDIHICYTYNIIYESTHACMRLNPMHPCTRPNPYSWRLTYAKLYKTIFIKTHTHTHYNKCILAQTQIYRAINANSARYAQTTQLKAILLETHTCTNNTRYTKKNTVTKTHTHANANRQRIIVTGKGLVVMHYIHKAICV